MRDCLVIIKIERGMYLSAIAHERLGVILEGKYLETFVIVQPHLVHLIL